MHSDWGFGRGQAHGRGMSRYVTEVEGVRVVDNDVVHGAELWVSDGSSDNTRLVKGILPGGPGSAPRELTVTGEFLYFTAEGSNGFKLWRSDRTSDGTIEVHMGAEYPKNVTTFKENLFFCGNSPDSFAELWIVGTEHSAALVRDIAKGPDSSERRIEEKVGTIQLILGPVDWEIVSALPGPMEFARASQVFEKALTDPAN